jgi:O-antigen ligase
VIASAALAAVCVASALLVDPGAEAAFDAPKRLATVAGIAVATVVILAHRPARRTPWSRAQRVAVVLAVCGLAGVLLAALLSPRPVVALDTTRMLLVQALLVPLGASAALDGRGGVLVVAAFVGATVVNAVVSLLQAAEVFQPFAIAYVSGRAATGALIGNEGQLALTLALAAVVTLGILPRVRDRRVRGVAVVALVVLGSTLVVNRSFTALAAVAAGIAVLGMRRGGRRAGVALLAGFAILAGAAMVAAPLRARVAKAVADARAGEWDDLTSNRLGAWAAAVEMARARPLVGWGPGTFAAEFVPHRLAAEHRHRTRFVIPRLTSSYAETHNEYLQALAELGVPTTLALLGTSALLVGGLARRPRDDVSTLVLAVLVTGAVAALAWFPLQRPASAVPLLLAAGRAWRLLA